jgi:hypothetical protein
MWILKGRGGFEEGDSVFFKVRGGLVGVPLVVAEDDRRHAHSMCRNTCRVKAALTQLSQSKASRVARPA